MHRYKQYAISFLQIFADGAKKGMNASFGRFSCLGATPRLQAVAGFG